MYQGSKQHKANFSAARKKAQQKIHCPHCNIQRTIANMTKHIASCYLNPQNIKPCVVCTKPIKNYKTNITCGYSCSNKHFRSGPNNGSWKEDSYRSTCFHYHKKECIICEEQNIVTVHHLDENHSNNVPANLIPMCPTHHQYWHSRYRYLIEDQVREYINGWSA